MMKTEDTEQLERTLCEKIRRSRQTVSAEILASGQRSKWLDSHRAYLEQELDWPYPGPFMNAATCAVIRFYEPRWTRFIVTVQNPRAYEVLFARGDELERCPSYMPFNGGDQPVGLVLRNGGGTFIALVYTRATESDTFADLLRRANAEWRCFLEWWVLRGFGGMIEGDAGTVMTVLREYFNVRLVER